VGDNEEVGITELRVYRLLRLISIYSSLVIFAC
jgi:hypothetical protein